MELKDLRKAAGLTLERLAVQLGTSKAVLSRIENKRHAPNASLQMKLIAWAEAERKRQRLPVAERVDWTWVHEKTDGRRGRPRGGGGSGSGPQLTAPAGLLA